MARVRVGDIDVHYELNGEGPPVVLIHGLGNDLRVWDDVARILVKHHRVLRYDVRGFGGTDKPSGAYSMPQMAHDLAGLLDALEIPTAVVMGVSMGGVIAQRTALDFADRVDALVLVSTSSEVGPRAAAAWSRLAGMIESRGFDARSADASRAFSPDFAARRPEVVAEMARRNASNDPRAYAAAARASSEYGWTDALGSVTVPTLIVQGNEDRLTPPGGSVKMRRALPNAHLLLLDGVGHNVQAEQPEVLAYAVVAFLAGIQISKRVGSVAPGSVG